MYGAVPAITMCGHHAVSTYHALRQFACVHACANIRYVHRSLVKYEILQNLFTSQQIKKREAQLLVL